MHRVLLLVSLSLLICLTAVEFSYPDSTDQESVNSQTHLFDDLTVLAERFAVAGDTATAIELYEVALKSAQESGDKLLIALTASRLGDLAKNTRVGFYRATECLQIAAQIYRERGDIESEVRQLSTILSMSNIIFPPDELEEVFDRVVSFYRESGDKEGEYSAIVNVASARTSISFGKTERNHLLEALAYARQTGSTLMQAKALKGLAKSCDNSSNIDTCVNYRASSVFLFRELEMIEEAAEGLDDLGMLLLRVDRGDSALSCYAESRRLWHELGDEVGSMSSLVSVAIALHKIGKYEAAADSLSFVKQVYISHSDDHTWNYAAQNAASELAYWGLDEMATPFLQVAIDDFSEYAYPDPSTLMTLASNYAKIEEYDSALSVYDRILAANPSTYMEILTLEDMSEIHAAAGRPQEGLKVLQQAEELCPEVKGGEELCVGLPYTKARILHGMGDYDAALTILDSLLSDAEAEGLPEKENLPVYIYLANLYYDMGRLDESLEFGERALKICQSIEWMGGHPGLEELIAEIKQKQNAADSQ